MKIAVITGATSGIGREMVKETARAYKWLDEIWVIGRRLERMQKLQRKLPVKLRILPLDLTKEIDMTDLRVLLEDQKPKIKLLINAAGCGQIGEFEVISRRENSEMIDLNCRALTEVTYLALPYMRGGSRIIQMASSAAFLPQPGFAVYAATKSYVLSFSRALRYELMKRDITVTCVCSGPVATEFFSRAEKYGKMESYKKDVMVSPAEVAGTALVDAAAGKELSVYGMPMKGVRILSKLVPHKCLLNVMEMRSRR